MKYRVKSESKFKHPGWELLGITFVPQYRWLGIWLEFPGELPCMEPRAEFQLECEAVSFIENKMNDEREKSRTKTLSTIVKQYG